MPGRVFSSRDSLQRTTTTRRTASLFVAANNNNTPDGIAEALGVPVEKLLALNQETFPGLNATSQFKAGTLLRVPPEVKATLPAGSKTATTQSDAKERGGRAGACSPGEKRGREGAGGAESCKTAKRGTPDGGASPGTSSAGGKTNSRSSLTSDSLERIDQHLAPKPIPKKGSTGTEVTEGTAVKRGRGRPRGRTSTKLSHRGEMGSTGTEVTEGIAVKRGRGRPRGRKSTNPQQKGSTGTEVTKGTAVKRKLGRPRGRTSTNPPHTKKLPGEERLKVGRPSKAEKAAKPAGKGRQTVGEDFEQDAAPPVKHHHGRGQHGSRAFKGRSSGAASGSRETRAYMYM